MSIIIMIGTLFMVLGLGFLQNIGMITIDTQVIGSILLWILQNQMTRGEK